VALAFHVTYWDYLGWKDPFSTQTATDRQARYGQWFGDGSYTPEIVVDGGTGLVGSYRNDVTTLGPEGPSFRSRERVVPASGQ
jgi:hypothetical protein